jgi:hypothetical protein
MRLLIRGFEFPGSPYRVRMIRLGGFGATESHEVCVMVASVKVLT